MTITTSPTRAPRPGPPSPTQPTQPTTRAARSQAAVIAGAALLLMSALAGFGIFVAVEGLATPGDAARTVADLRASEGTFRLGVLSLYGIVVLDVVVAWALFHVFAPVSGRLSMLGAWLRLAYAAIFAVAVTHLAGVPRLLDGDGYAASLTEPERQAQALLALDAFQDLWMAGLVLFGLHLLVEGALAFRSGFVPRLLAALVGLAGLGYVVDSVGAVLSPDAPTVSAVTFAGELLLGVWLLVRSRRVGAVQDA